MKVVHISGMDNYNSHESGNYLVFKVLRGLGYDSSMILGLAKSKDDPDTFYYPMEKMNEVGFEDTINPDVVILYDSALEPETIKRIYDKHKCPFIYVGMGHDFFTGGCPYPQQNQVECKKYKKSCGACNQIESKDPFDKTYSLMQRKLTLLKDIPIYGVGVSDYTLSLMNESSLMKDWHNECIAIPNEVPISTLEKKDIRNRLGLPEESLILLWGTTQPQCLRKGKNYLEGVISKIEGRLPPSTTLVTVGPKIDPTLDIKMNHVEIGYCKSREDLAHIYKLADIGLQTTVEDAGPMMVTECLSNGTPIVSFDNCVATNMVKQGETGFVVPTRNVDEFADRVVEIFSKDKDFGKNAKHYVDLFNNKDRVLSQWETLLKKVLK